LTSLFKELDDKTIGILDTIFAVSNKPISIKTFMRILNVDKKKAIKILDHYINAFNRIHKGIKIKKKRDFYYLVISEKYLNYARHYMRPPPLTEKQKTVLAYIYSKKEVPQRDLSRIFGPSVYRDLKKLRTLGFISIVKRDNMKYALFRDEAEAYIIRKRGRRRIEAKE